MYLGKMMELADSDELNDNPIHPYTQSLLSAVPIPDPKTARQAQRIVLEGDVPSPLHMPSGCPFRTRCRYATEQCAKEMPPFTDRGNGHYVKVSQNLHNCVPISRAKFGTKPKKDDAKETALAFALSKAGCAAIMGLISGETLHPRQSRGQRFF